MEPEVCCLSHDASFKLPTDTLQPTRSRHVAAVTREQHVRLEEESSPDARGKQSSVLSPRRSPALHITSFLKMSRGVLLPYAMFLNAVCLGTLLRLSQAAVYTNDWAIKITADEEAVKRIAEKHGFTNLGQVGDGRERGRLSGSVIQPSQSSHGLRQRWSCKQNSNKCQLVFKPIHRC